MVAEAPDRRSSGGHSPSGARGRLAGAAALALLLAGLALLLEPEGRRGAAAVLVAVALLTVRLARPWTAALPGLLGGVLVGRALRPPPPPPGPEPGADPPS